MKNYQPNHKFQAMIARIFTLFFGLLILATLQANSNKKSTDKKAFKDGEHLKYLLRYGPIKGGHATLSLNSVKYKGEYVYHAKALAKSTGMTDKLFKIEDIYESYFDKETCLPKKAIRNISEGKYKFYNEVFFDHQNDTLYSQKSGMYETPENILDILSSLYYLRNVDFDTVSEGDVIHLVTFFGDEIFPFDLRYRGKEVVKTKLGSFRCHRFDPVVEVGRIFESEDDMTFWISDDDNLIPILVRFDMIVGSVRCELIEFANMANQISSAVRK